MVGWVVYVLGGFSAIVLGPAMFARSEPDAPISRAITSFLRACGPASEFVYFAITILIAVALLWGIVVLQHTRHGRTEPGAAPNAAPPHR